MLTKARATAPAHRLRRVFIVSVAIGAVVAGLLALHLANGSAAGAPASTIGSTERLLTIGSTERLLPETDALDADSLTAVSERGTKAGVFSLDCDHHRALGCAVIALMCALLVILIGVIFLARSPALLHRLVDSGRVALRPFSETRNHVYQPSLAVLSISRT